MKVTAPTLFITATLLVTPAWAGQAPGTDGRYFPDGFWQARNTHATQEAPQGPKDNPFDIFTEWGTDIRLSYTEGLRIHDPEIAAWGNYVYVTWWNVDHEQIELARSTDLGVTWQPQVWISDTLDNYTGIPQITAWDSCAYIVYTIAATRVWMAKSMDYGQSWSRSEIYGAGRNRGGGDNCGQGQPTVLRFFHFGRLCSPPEYGFIHVWQQ